MRVRSAFLIWQAEQDRVNAREERVQVVERKLHQIVSEVKIMQM